MKHTKKLIFLGYNKKQTRLISFLRSKKIKVVCIGQKKINFDKISTKDKLIVFGYRKIINKKILNKLRYPPINLHMSYLPYNKGSHPNYWSFIDKTPAGVTIHEINEAVDSGKIIFQKKIKFKLNKKSSFNSTYKLLFNELESLFCRHYKAILKNNYKANSQKKGGTFHSKKELPKNFKWRQSILDYIKKSN